MPSFGKARAQRHNCILPSKSSAVEAGSERLRHVARIDGMSERAEHVEERLQERSELTYGDPASFLLSLTDAVASNAQGQRWFRLFTWILSRTLHSRVFF
jgi:hypothetical protein